jgi:hypothetical protein
LTTAQVNGLYGYQSMPATKDTMTKPMSSENVKK